MAKIKNAPVDDGLGDDDDNHGRVTHSRTTPHEDRLVLYDGATVSQLCELFNRDAETVRKLLRHIKPAGRRRGIDLFHIREAAPYLVKPVIDEETFIKTITRTQDLPPYLQKEFWAAQKARQDYEIRAGDLWATDDVLFVFGEVFKKLSTGINLFADTIEARTELSKDQRSMIVEQCDNLRTELKRVLAEGEYERVEITEREKVVSNPD